MEGVSSVGTESASGKSAIALGAHELLAGRFPRVGLFRPVVAANSPDPVLDLLASRQSAD